MVKYSYKNVIFPLQFFLSHLTFFFALDLDSIGPEETFDTFPRSVACKMSELCLFFYRNRSKSRYRKVSSLHMPFSFSKSCLLTSYICSQWLFQQLKICPYIPFQHTIRMGGCDQCHQVTQTQLSLKKLSVSVSDTHHLCPSKLSTFVVATLIVSVHNNG